MTKKNKHNLSLQSILNEIDCHNKNLTDYDCIGYLRISTDLQTLASQYEKIKNFYSTIKDSKGIYYICDIDSRRNMEREGLCLLKEMISQGSKPIKIVIIYDVSRLGADPVENYKFITFLKEYGVKCYDASDGKIIDITHPTEEFSFLLKSIFSKTELDMLRKRVIDGRERALKSGNLPYKLPFGYKKDEKTGRPVLSDPDEVELVRFCFEKIKEVSLDKLSEMLMKDKKYSQIIGKVRSPLTRSKIYTFIQTVIKNPIYAGVIVDNLTKLKKSEIKYWKYLDTQNHLSSQIPGVSVYLNAFPSIVSMELFKEANEALYRRRTYSEKYKFPPRARSLSPFYGKVTCAHHNGILSIRRKSHNKGFVYMCRNKTCPNFGMEYKKLDKEILEVVCKTLEEKVAPIIEKSKEEIEKKISDLKRVLKTKYQQCESIKKNLHGLVLANENLQITPEIYLQKRNKLKKEETQSLIEIAKLKTKIKLAEKEVKKFEQGLKDITSFKAAYYNMNIKEKRKIIDLFVKRIWISNRKIKKVELNLLQKR